MKFLCDTNIFLEILRQRKHHNTCRLFLEKNIAQIAISDFSLFSLCIHAEKESEESITHQFILSLLEQGMKILQTSNSKKLSILLDQKNSKLDYDDYLQYSLAKDHKLTLMTLDGDFKKAKLDITVKKP